MWELRQIFIRLFFVLLLFVPFACSDVSSEDSTEVENSVLNFTSRYARYPASLVSEKFREKIESAAMGNKELLKVDQITPLMLENDMINSYDALKDAANGGHGNY